jgi:hypothetical protein
MTAVAGQWPIGVATRDVRALTATARTVLVSGAVVDLQPVGCDYSDSVVLLGRLKPGRAVESRRVVHVFQLSPDLLPVTTLTARCDEQLPVDDLQWLPGLVGMPCEKCLLRSV